MNILDFLFKRTARKRFGLSSQSKEFVKIKWNEIEELVKLGKPSNLKQAVISADKLVYYVLGELGYQGTLGERMISAKARFTDYGGIWGAHKLRNRVVHEIEHEMFHFEAGTAIQQYQRALIDLAAL